MMRIKVFTVAMLGAGLMAAQPGTPAKPAPATKALKYETAMNDPYKARIYTLSNGLTVYLSVYKDAPRIQTYIAVKAGSKNDPKDATGLAHYLEHMVFKGTDTYGTKDFAKESAEIKKIEDLYEVYRLTKDNDKRRKIYHEIDSISGVAAKYAIANEYDKMLAGIGGQGTNAFTSFDQTVYVNDIPTNQVENWLKIESERFRKPVLRLFHTELEAVYEEKNRGLDSDNDKVWEALFAALYTKHTYGTQTTIGTIEHLKNPSMKEINKYFQANYVPNNMAICMSGDFDPDATIALIEKYFGAYKTKAVKPYTFEKEPAITQKISREVLGPDAANIAMGWRFAGGAGTRDADMLTLINAILSNGKAGLMDINLNQSQKVLSSGGFAYSLKDYSTHILYGEPKAEQSLEEVEKLILDQLELVKKGDFADWLLPAIITDMKLQKTKELESNGSRAMAMVDAFVNGVKWQNYVSSIDRLSKITKAEVMDFAKKNYTAQNYAIVYKRTGEDKNVQKVEKPSITPVEVNREEQSAFVKLILESKPSEIQPVFIDYSKDIATGVVKNNIPMLYSKNIENATFDMYYVFDMGSNNDKVLPVAIEYIPYLGTSKYTPAQVQQELYKLGCSFNVFNSNDQTWVSLSGLSENFDKAVQLFEEVLSDPKVEDETLKNLVGDILKKRDDAKLNKSVILQRALVNYAKYGALNPFTNLLSEEELNKLTAGEIKNKISSLESYEHRVLYYGPKSMDDVKQVLSTSHHAPASLKPVPAEAKFVEQNLNNEVYVVEYDMKQAEIVMLSKGDTYNAKMAPDVSMYNEYFGGGMGSVVFQELRESKALAYSTYSFYRTPNRKDRAYYNFSYIGSQADKLPEAMAGMTELLTNLPKSDVLFGAAKESILQGIRTERITKSSVLFNYESAQKMGLNYDIRKDVFSRVQGMVFDNITEFQTKYVKGKPTTVLVLGKKELLDTKTLEKYGTVKYLTLKDVFGY